MCIFSNHCCKRKKKHTKSLVTNLPNKHMFLLLLFLYPKSNGPVFLMFFSYWLFYKIFKFKATPKPFFYSTIRTHTKTQIRTKSNSIRLFLFLPWNSLTPFFNRFSNRWYSRALSNKAKNVYTLRALPNLIFSIQNIFRTFPMNI